MKEDSKPTWKLNTVSKAISVLRAFDNQNPEWTLAALSAKFGLPKTTMLGTLRTLECNGFLYRTQNQSYRLGLDILELGYFLQTSLPISKLVLPLLEEIQVATGNFVYLTIPKNGKVFYLECAYPGEKKINYSIVGKTLPMHCNSCGKAMLSEFPNEQVEKVVETYGLPKFTPNTITDFSVLRKQLDIIKLRGFATENGERTIGTKCVGIPVKSNSGKLLGALSIAGPSIRMPDDRVDEFVGLLSNASMILSENETIFPTCSPYPIEV
jgi:DNA-binding IclR family transcriptional regulator